MDFDAFQHLAVTRMNVSARRLVAPGPNEAQLSALMTAAAAAPDHGQLAPWRFLLVAAAARVRLADAFAQALVERDASATAQEISKAKEKAYRAPTLLIAIVRIGGDPGV